MRWLRRSRCSTCGRFYLFYNWVGGIWSTPSVEVQFHDTWKGPQFLLGPIRVAVKWH